MQHLYFGVIWQSIGGVNKAPARDIFKRVLTDKEEEEKYITGILY